jgi:hypothetical protein
VEYGLDRHLTEAFRSQKDGGTTGEAGPEEATLLLQVLLALEPMTDDLHDGTKLLTEPACAAFVKLHESGGVHWFNRERFEMLAAWTALVAAWREENPKARARWSLWGAGMALRARKAGYRLDRFLEQEQAKGNIPEVPPPAS